MTGEGGLTPVRCASDVVLFLLLDRDETERHAKVGELDVPDLGCEDVGGLEVTVDDLTKHGRNSQRERTISSNRGGKGADLLRVEVVETLEDFDHVARDEPLVEFAERLERRT